MKTVSLLFLSISLLVLNGQAQTSSADSTTSSSFSIFSDSIIQHAKSFIGVPYLYGGSSPESGFDCSGFVRYVFSEFGLDLPHSTVDLSDVGYEIPLDSCRKGDIILFAGRNKEKRPIGHAGIVVSDLCEPLSFIHSATSNKRGVIISALDRYDYYRSRFVKIVRVVEAIGPQNQ